MGPVLLCLMWGDLTGQSEGERPGCVGDQRLKTRFDCESKVQIPSVAVCCCCETSFGFLQHT